MPVNIPARAVIATKQASGTVQFVIQSSGDGLNPNGDIQFVFVMPSADVTSVNTNVNGGATGATRTFVYAENATSGDYPLGYTGGL